MHSEQNVHNSNSKTVSNQIEKNETIQTEKSLVSNANSPFIYKKGKPIVVNSTHIDGNKDFLDRIRDKYMNPGDKMQKKKKIFGIYHLVKVFIMMKIISLIIFFPYYSLNLN